MRVYLGSMHAELFLRYRAELKKLEYIFFKSRVQIAFEIMLTLLFNSGSCFFFDIRNDIKATEASIRTHVRMLERQGLIVESEDHQDRRVRRVSLTDKGKKVSEDYIAAVLQNENFINLLSSNSMIGKGEPPVTQRT